MSTGSLNEVLKLMNLKKGFDAYLKNKTFIFLIINSVPVSQRSYITICEKLSVVEFPSLNNVLVQKIMKHRLIFLFYWPISMAVLSHIALLLNKLGYSRHTLHLYVLSNVFCNENSLYGLFFHYVMYVFSDYIYLVSSHRL